MFLLFHGELGVFIVGVVGRFQGAVFDGFSVYVG